MFIVVEIFDGEVNAIPCEDKKAAMAAKSEFEESILELDFEVLTDKPDLFEAEINSMIYSVEIRDMPIYKLEKAEDLPTLNDTENPV